MSEANQGPGPLEPVKRYLVKSIASGIGLASEGITSYKERKRLRRAGPSSVDATPPAYMHPSPRSSDEAPSNARQVATPLLSHHQQDDDFKHEQLWKLDDSQDESSPPPYTECATTPDEGTEQTTSSQSLKNIDKFLEKYPAPENSAAFTRAKLPQPVILPQKRPKTRSRGFIRAYAPSLGPCGIPQDMFLDFITTFDASTQASPWLDAINLASIGLSFIPHFPMLVGIAIQVSIMAAKDVQNRARTNSFLDKANAQVFMPRGLYCLVMTYSPEQDDDDDDDDDDDNGNRNRNRTRGLAEGTDVSATIASKVGSTGLQKFQARFRDASGHACEAELPQSAPLIFPCLNEGMSAEELEESRNAREKMKRAQKYITDYYDKRAQAKFAGRYGGSGLVKGPTPSFTSRFADPNHPACSGSFRSLITGGYITPPEMGRSRSEEGREDHQDRFWDGQRQDGSGEEHGQRVHGREKTLCENRQSNSPAPHAPYGGRPSSSQSQSPTRSRDMAGKDQDLIRLGPVGLPTAGTLVKKALKKNILYMMIVNMPSDEELARAIKHLEQSRSKGIPMADFITHLRGR